MSATVVAKMHIGQIHAAMLSSASLASLFLNRCAPDPLSFSSYPEADFVSLRWKTVSKMVSRKTGYVALGWSEPGSST